LGQGNVTYTGHDNYDEKMYKILHKLFIFYGLLVYRFKFDIYAFGLIEFFEIYGDQLKKFQLALLFMGKYFTPYCQTCCIVE